MKANLIQKSYKDESFFTNCFYCPQGDMEVSFLNFYEVGYYEVLILKKWNLTGESSPQSDRFQNVGSKDEPKKTFKPQTQSNPMFIQNKSRYELLHLSFCTLLLKTIF